MPNIKKKSKKKQFLLKQKKQKLVKERQKQKDEEYNAVLKKSTLANASLPARRKPRKQVRMFSDITVKKS